MIPVKFVDPITKISVRVSDQGELFTRQLKFGEVEFNSMAVIDTANNFFKARAGERFIITGILINSNKDVGANGAIVDIYEASSTTSLTVDKQLVQLNILKKFNNLNTLHIFRGNSRQVC